MLDFESMVTALQSQYGIDRTRAEAIARENLKLPAAPGPEDVRRENALEKTEQYEIMKLFRAFAFQVYNLSQARASKIAPGVPDLWCVHRDQPIAFFFECKRSAGGKFSEAQIRFREQAVRCGIGYASGDRRAARHHLITLGLARVVGNDLEPIRSGERERQRA